MRVPDAAVFDAVTKRLTRTRADVDDVQQKVATGLRVQKPSDDPVAAAAARREKTKLALSEAGMRATELATTHLTAADEALAAAFDGMLRVKEIAMQASSTTLGAEQRAHLAAEVRTIREQMVAFGNTEAAGSYVFAGYRDGEPPFSAAGAFVADGTSREVQAYPGLRVTSSISGAEAFGSDGADGVFATLEALHTALSSNDQVGVRATLDDLDTNERRILSARARIGAMMDNVQTAGSVAERYNFAATLESARLTEADELDAIADMMKARTAYEAAVTVARQIQVGGLVQSRG
jgi:flagellar hook-associated protein 3 FlgL